MKCIIVEDEETSIKRLMNLLDGMKDVQVIAVARSVDEAIEKANELKPDLMFLDINLPGGNGFDVLNAVEHKPLVIFITAYDEYAIRAFEENAVDYLLKPFSRERLQSALEKLKRYRGDVQYESLKSLMNGLKRRFRELFPVRLGDEIRLIRQDEIYYFEADGKNVYINLENERFRFTGTLKDLEQELDPDRFVRVHRSYVVALDKMHRLRRWFKGEYILELKNGARIKVSRSYYPTFKKKLGL